MSVIYTSECGRYIIEENIYGKFYGKNGDLHRDDDLPACEYYDNTRKWYKNGKLHRDGDLPAVEWKDGSKSWYKDGKRHRDGDLPAIECSNGSKEYWKNGKLHRDGDLPAIEYSNGCKRYWKNGVLYNPFEKLKLKTGDILTVIYEGKDREIEKDKIVTLKCKIKEK